MYSTHNYLTTERLFQFKNQQIISFIFADNMIWSTALISYKYLNITQLDSVDCLLKMNIISSS